MHTTAQLAADTNNGFWLPHDINEVIWGTLAFLVVMYLLWKFTAKLIGEYYTKRGATIGAELEAAAEARLAAEAERDRIKAALADSDAESARIVEEAHAMAEQLARDTAARAEAEAERIRERAAADLATTRAQAQSDLAGELARLSYGAAEQIVRTTLDEDAQQRLIDSYISQVGAQN